MWSVDVRDVTGFENKACNEGMFIDLTMLMIIK